MVTCNEPTASALRTSDPLYRVVTLAAACGAYRVTENPLLERCIDLLQNDTRAWLLAYPEHARSFCDGFYERREEIRAMAAQFAGCDAKEIPWYDHEGVWGILGARYEPRELTEMRFRDLGYSVIDLEEQKDQVLDGNSPASDHTAAATREATLTCEEGLPLEATVPRSRMRKYSFWLPERTQDYGEFVVAIPHELVLRMERIRDYGYAGGRFPTHDYREFFKELAASGIIDAATSAALDEWIDFKRLPIAAQEQRKAASPHRPITDHPDLRRRFEALGLGDPNKCKDELQAGEVDLTRARHAAAATLERLRRPGKE